MTKINIGTNQGNVQGAEINKPFDKIRYQDVYETVKNHKKFTDKENLRIIGWCKNENH